MTAISAPTILHVDDDHASRYSLGLVLTAHGFRVVEAATGTDALRLAQAGPDLILLDVCLPDLSGFAVCRALRADPVTAAIPVVQISGQLVRGEDRAQGLEGGADAYLTKPVEPRELTAHLASLLRVRRAEQAFRSLADNVPDIIARFDRDLRFVYVNRHVETVTGLPAARFLGKTNRDQGLPTDLVCQWSQALHTVFASGQASSIEFPFTTPNGPRLYETRLVPERTPSGTVETVLALSRDVTEQRRAEEALRQSNDSLRAIIQASPLAIIASDLAGNVTAWNPEAERMFGWSEQEVLGRPVPTIPADGQAEYRALRARALGGERLDGQEERRFRKDGTALDVRLSTAPLHDARGDVRGIVAVIDNITERKRDEARLSQALAELQALTAHQQSVREEERARIAREIHDELGQALTGLKLDAAWVKGRIARGLPDAQSAPLIERVESMSAAIDATVHTMRRIAAELRPSVLDDFGLLAALEWQADELQRRTGIHCTVAGDPGDLAPDRATALFRIAQEALTNVARHAGATEVHINVRREPGWIALEVQDNGRGAAPEELGRVGSFGILGMRERAALAGGEIEIEGRPGRGVRLEARIPTEPPSGGGAIHDPCPDRG